MSQEYKRKSLYIYDWFINDSDDNVSIRIYGIDKKKRNVCLYVNDFLPHIYIELPECAESFGNLQKINWNNRLYSLKSSITKLINNSKQYNGINCDDEKIELEYKSKLYYANIDKNKKRKVFPFLKVSIPNKKILRFLVYTFKKPVAIAGLGRLKYNIHEQDASLILQFISKYDIPTTGWVTYLYKNDCTDKNTYCDKECIVKSHNINRLHRDYTVNPLVLSFDIEVYSSNPSKMPTVTNPTDKIFQISCVLKRGLEDSKKYLLTLGDPDEKVCGDDTNVLRFTTETRLLEGYTQFLQEHNPNVIIGYNIFGFDIPYMIKRSTHICNCMNNFDKQGFYKDEHSTVKTVNWSSSAYGNQIFEYLDTEGRIHIDLLPLIKRDYRMSNYKLSTVSEFFLGNTKDDLDARGIFKCYEEGLIKDDNGNYTPNARRQMGVCGHYCVQDSVLVMNLFVKTQQWIGLCEMAKTCNVPMTVLYTQGQQIKVYSQVYKYNYENNIITQKDGYITNKDDHYIGATVFPPKPGIYNRVLPFDFKSLYPTIIIAYNIDYSTLVPDDSDIPDNDCNIIEWKEHIGCEHDPDMIRKRELDIIINDKKDMMKDLRKDRDKCKNKVNKECIKKEIEDMKLKLKPFIEERSIIVKKKHKFILCNDERRFRFLKEPKGVLPTVLQGLLDARKNTRVQIKQLKKYLKSGEIDDNIRDLLLNGDDKKIIETLITVLDKRQLSYKVSCNSMYGAMGVSRGYLPFMPGAMCTTAKGRQNIGIVADVIQNKYKGQLVYGDTDSNYIRFPHLKTAKENWDYAIYVAKQVSDIFPNPIELEFEEEIYWTFAILTKKRYMYQKCKRDGKVDTKVGNKGVLLSRRDNSKLVRELYEIIMMKIFSQVSIDEVYYYIISEINKLCSGVIDSNMFVITKKIGNHEKKITKGHKDVTVYLECSKCEHIILCDNSRYNNSCKCTIQERDKGIMGEYRVPLLDTSDEKSVMKQFKLKNCSNIEQYYARCLPAQVQLAEIMRKDRGQRVEQGSRIEYVITLNGNHNGKQYEKIEHIDYFNRHKYEKQIDYLYYLNMISKPIDQLLNIMYAKDKYFVKNFVEKQYKLRSKYRTKYLDDISKLTIPDVNFE